MTGDLVRRLRRGAAVFRELGEAADEIERLEAIVASVEAAVDAFAKATGKDRGASLGIQQHDPSWKAWKRLCDTLPSVLGD